MSESPGSSHQNPFSNRPTRGRHARSMHNRGRGYFHKNVTTENTLSGTDSNTRTLNSSNFSKRGHGQSNRNQNFKSKMQKKELPENAPRLMSLDSLKALLKQDPEELLLTILNEDKGFMVLLQQTTDWDITSYLLLIVGKALSACMQMHVRSLILKINDSESFLNRIQKYLVSFHLNSPQQHHLSSLTSLSSLLGKLRIQFPSSSSDLLIKLIPQLRKTCDEYLVHSDEYEAIKETLDDINNQNDLFLRNFTPAQAKTICDNEKLQIAEPPENYRTIPVLPIAEDMRKSAFLRPNLVAGSYKDTEHYLDVQFRLLREDYIKPLREGIAEYQELKESGKPLKNCKNVRVYEDVHIISQQYVYAGLIHVALFSDANFVDIKWEYSKRFLTGSLLCLTDDDFETMLFATVAERNVKKLTEGKLIVRFEELSDEVLNLSPLRSFTVIETTAYFEAYRHNLKALSELDEAKLPMQRYIVKVEKEVSKPAYLNEDVTYDFRPLLLPLDKKYIKLPVKEEVINFKVERKVMDATYILSPEIKENASKISVLTDSSWPSHTDLSLDPSQYAALKSAVTKEFAVIQGPPGTGKTYIGLRIVQLLLHNFNNDWTLKSTKSPILIVCYTNHALDQFLEGVSLFTQKIVRIGGRGKTEALEKFQLSNLKHHLNYKSSVPDSVFDNIKSKQTELYDLRREIASKRESLETSNRTVLKMSDIRDCIPNIHLLSLEFRLATCKSDVLFEWLGLSEGAVNNLQYEDVEFSDSDEENEEVYSFFPVFTIELRDIIDLDSNKPKLWTALKTAADCKERIYGCISNILTFCSPLSDNEAHNIRNVSKLSNTERWQLYKYWVSVFLKKIQKEYATLDSERKIKQDQNKVPKRYARAHNADLAKLNKKIAYKRNCIKVCSKYVISEEMLADCIPPHQFTSLKKFNRINFEQNRAIFNWLKLKMENEDSLNNRIRFVQELQMVADYFREQFKLAMHDNPFVDVGEEFDADDIEYLEAQRNIDSEEFMDVSFDLPTRKHKKRELVPQENEWKYQGGKKKLRKYIKNNLYSDEKMSETEANNINDVWVLPISKRWQLYKFWWQLYIENKQAETLGMQQKFREQYKELSELRSLEDAYLCQRADIVGMTTTGAAKYKHIIEFLNPKIVIVEEAAEILESHIVTSLAPKTQHVVLIGDHQQLRPSPTVHLLSVKYGLNVSLFERMVKNGMECQQLKIQHRMRPDVARLLVPHIYEELENHESVLAYESIRGFAKDVFFLSHSNLEFQEGDSKSKVNQHEARFLIQLCKYLILQNYDPSQITILTTYSGQLFEIKRLAKGIIDGVRITVVDNFQGEENDIILVSFVRSNQLGEIGFLKISNRICVALSRAKKGLYCIGNFQVLGENSKTWNKIISLLKESDNIGNLLELRCQNHPEMSSFVATENDFDSVQDGGCHLMCEYRLECGHVCPRKCHPDDQEHIKIKCYKPCSKTCRYDHLCQKRCFKECGDCHTPVVVKVETCGHDIEVACFRQNSKLTCTAICTKILPCGHEKNVQCYRKDREVKCTEICIKLLTCGHEISTECFVNVKDIKCLKKCKKSLPCDHDCTNTCSDSCITRCVKLCTFKSIICGHDVTDKCYRREDTDFLLDNCSIPCGQKLPCQHVCEGTCSGCRQGSLHIKCTAICTKILSCGHETNVQCYLKDAAIQCTETCLKVLSCGHEISTKCFINEEDIKCLENCKKSLSCGHDCTNLCSDDCVTKCEKLCTFKSTICGHDVKDKCYRKEDTDYLLNICPSPCERMPCLHFCEGTCGSCHQGRLHIVCNKKCKKTLICGHDCDSICSKNCPPCKKLCSNWCDHKKCLKNCSESCNMCCEPCLWTCIHKQCTRMCGQLCNRTPCLENCQKTLECGHACLGFCGEPCPKICITCDPDNEAFKGTGHIFDPKYILLEDCNHVFESNFLYQYLRQGNLEQLGLKSCPKCETVIRKNFHFGNIIKSFIDDVERVKIEGERIKEQINDLFKVIKFEAEILSDDYSSLKCVLSSPKNRSIQEILIIRYFIKLIMMFENVSNFIKTYEFDSSIMTIPYSKELIAYMKSTMSWISPVLRDDYLTSSHQQMLELNWEILRLTLGYKFVQFFLRQPFVQRTRFLITDKPTNWRDLKNSIMTYKPFKDPDLQKCISEWAALSDVSFKELTIEKINLSRLIDYSLEQWRKCKSGHLFFAECDKKSMCNVCE